MKKNKEIIYLGKYSNSQNGQVYGINGIAPCVCSGGNGHDATVPKILLFEVEEITSEKENKETIYIDNLNL